MGTTLITGGTGLIGSAVATRLVARGEAVVLLDTMPSHERISALREEFPEGDVTVETGDVSTLAALVEIVQRLDVDAVVHLASLLGPDSDANPGLAARVNCEGTTNVLDVARLCKLRRAVLASSIAVYGNDAAYSPVDFPLTEEAAQVGAPGMRMYAAAKIYTEHLAKHYQAKFGLSVVGLRPSVVHGPGRRTGATAVVTRIIEDAALGTPVTVGLGDARMSLIYVDEVAAQFVALLDAPQSAFTKHQFFNSGGFTCTVAEFAEVVRALAPESQITVEPSDARDVGGLATSISGELLIKTTGYRPTYPTVQAGVLHQMDLVRSRAHAAR